MTKTVRILSIIVAAVVVILVVLPVLFGSQINEDIRNFLNSPSVLESFKNAKKSGAAGAESPLVEQAKAFALYLNPPKPKPKPAKTLTSRQTPAKRPQAPVKAKFNLEATSYYAARPELSLALISEPGKGLKWVRQSSQIGHLVVQEVLDGKIVIKDGSRTYELEPKRQSKKSLIKGAPGSSVRTAPKPTTTAAISSPVKKPTVDIAHSRAGTRPRTIPPKISRPAVKPQPELSAKQIAMMDAFAKDIKDIEDVNELERHMEKFVEKFDELSEISGEEAEDLEELGQKLSESQKQK